ncbi:GntR family transcriptional regulator / MocR family aminotransferase [Parapedobacter luteus]|uniref:GntR family transcriptional regulator / MocR family aminotransferase n=1 Tax=Parapedobacter luteus TaxID=623280 RepID=A0A1T5AIG4_9SPHI|nr:PLP-dependent aminotransferase family protein [Parapedobacter luteus]SKB34537.1 GntR family transcriptional regulator / MocR family aminotransferase [Parapedobacter luteus]
MGSPVLVPYRSFIQIDRLSATPVYLQVANQLISAIQRGYLTDGHKLPGSRQMGKLLGVHRNTVAASYAELDAQGWIAIHPSKGSFVSNSGAEKKRRLRAMGVVAYPQQAGFHFRKWSVLDNPFDYSSAKYTLDDGLPDPRLSHVDYLTRLLRTNMKRKGNRPKLGYNNMMGVAYYKENLANFLNLTRGLHISKEHILVTRSLELSVYIVAETLITPGDRVVVGELSYFATNMILQKAGAAIMTVPVDAEGLDVAAIRTLCERQPFRMLYITPHHHYPTTVAFSAQRRAELLELSAQYGFVIVEDDYDYDFHYDDCPQLPMASTDTEGMVVYVGTFGKPMAPGFRSGFIVAPPELINEMGKLLGVMDRHGDALTELALGEMIADGEIHRYLKKTTLEYKARRNMLASLLNEHLASFVDFNVPSGGLAIWTRWPKELNLMRLRDLCAQHEVHLPRYLLYQSNMHCGIRLGFGSLPQPALTEVVALMGQAARTM